MTGAREAILTEVVNSLLEARRTLRPMVDLPAVQQPADMTEVYWVQDKLAEAYGEVGGWKVGAPNAEATPIFAPMPAAWIAASGSCLAGGRYRGLEAEIAFLVGQDLPPRPVPYTRDEALAAMASCHPAIEVLESSFVDPAKAAKLASFADLQMHGGFVFGEAISGWRDIAWNNVDVALIVDGVVRVEAIGSNTSGDLLKLLPWLANEGAARTGGLKAGQWITTGSWTGNIQTSAGGTVSAHFTKPQSTELGRAAELGRVDLRFE